MVLARHSYPARAANCLNADWPDVSNCCLRIMWATSMPSSVAEADLKDLTSSTSIRQNHPFNISTQFMFRSPAKLAPILSITTLSGKPLLPIARVKKAVAAASSRCF